jgi:hypothetical protein
LNTLSTCSVNVVFESFNKNIIHYENICISILLLISQRSCTFNGKTITIDYSRHSFKGRKIFGELVPYGQVWRAGANETTAFTLSADAQVGGKNLPAGKYAFFVIPNEKEWTVVFNKTIKWGAFSYKQEEDVLRINVPVKKSNSFAEQLTYNVSPAGNVSLTWENAVIEFPVK